MAKLNTYELKGALEATLQLIGIIPGTGSAFETVRVSNEALVAFIQQYAGEDGTNGKQVELRKGSTNIEWRYVGDPLWTALIAIADLQGGKGDPGERIQMQKSATAIQWKYESAVSWTDLVLLSDLKGSNGTNGRTMWATTGAPSGALGVDGDFANDSDASMMYGPKTAGSWGTGKSYKGEKGDTGTGLKNRGAWVTGTTYQPGDYVFSTGSSTSSSMWILNGETPYVSNTLPKDALTKWVEFVAPAGADGVNGKNVEMRNSGTVIQWRLVGDATWADLVTVADLKGAPGNPGNPGANGKSVLTTTGAPANGFGTDGDFANDADAQVMYGPKSGGTWPAGKSYKGTNGTPGTNGTNGSKWFTGSVVPAAGTGADGDFYLRDTGDVYGPKAAGAWGSVVASLKGVKGDPGSAGAGIPAGGTTGQVLSKRSNTDLDLEWKTPASGGSGDAVLLTGDQTAAGVKTFSNRVVVGSPPATGAPAVSAGTGLVIYKDAIFDNPVLLTKRLNMKLGYKNEDVIPITPSAGVATLTQHNAQQKIMLTADVATLTLKMPDASGNSEGNVYPVIDRGSVFRVFFPFAVGALTVTPGKNSFWWEDAKVLGAPATILPGFYDIQFMGDGQWYFSQSDNPSRTVVDGFDVFRFSNGMCVAHGPITTTSSFPANADFTISVPIPDVFPVGNKALIPTLYPSVGNDFSVKNTQAPGATASIFCRNGASAQTFSGNIRIEGRWK